MGRRFRGKTDYIPNKKVFSVSFCLRINEKKYFSFEQSLTCVEKSVLLSKVVVLSLLTFL